MSKEIEVEQCDWHCPKCHSRCGGVKGHSGPHQCPKHYKPPYEKKELRNVRKS